MEAIWKISFKISNNAYKILVAGDAMHSRHSKKARTIKGLVVCNGQNNNDSNSD